MDIIGFIVLAAPIAALVIIGGIMRLVAVRTATPVQVVSIESFLASEQQLAA